MLFVFELLGGWLEVIKHVTDALAHQILNLSLVIEVNRIEIFLLAISIVESLHMLLTDKVLADVFPHCLHLLEQLLIRANLRSHFMLSIGSLINLGKSAVIESCVRGL